MLTSRFVALSLALGLVPLASRGDCVVRDFMSEALPEIVNRPTEAVALELAYPGISVDETAGKVTVNGTEIPFGELTDRPASKRMADPSILDQFAQIYPLDFDLESRKLPWFDPGRARHEGFFKALYGQSENEIAKSLRRVEYRGIEVTARFSATKRYCIAQQLQAALDAISRETGNMDKFFQSIGGSFNWRRIAGTGRLSAHSFGIAVDFNTQLGGYWKWSGAEEGRAFDYDNKFPKELVQQMERFGFIWGGKWHHFDGMHFEYRPELVIYSRLKKK